MTTPEKPSPNKVRLALFRPEMTDEEIDAALDRLYEGTEFENKTPKEVSMTITERTIRIRDWGHRGHCTLYVKPDGSVVLEEQLLGAHIAPDGESEYFVSVAAEHAGKVDVEEVVAYLKRKRNPVAIYEAWLEARNIPFKSACV